MPRIVLDASAVLAVILEEPGADVVVEALRSGAAMSTVNVAEVAARLHQDGWSDAEVALVFDSLGIELLPFDPEAALLSGRLRTAARESDWDWATVPRLASRARRRVSACSRPTEAGRRSTSRTSTWRCIR